MYPATLPLSERLRSAHAQTWQLIAQPGDFFTGDQRQKMVRAAREALTCHLCERRKAALSPIAVEGEHDDSTGLDEVIVDVVHRIRTDPGRLTRAWFDQVLKRLSAQEYVEIVSVVTSSVIVDTLHNALGLGVAALPSAQSGRPGRSYNEDAVDAGGWVPMLDASQDMADTGLPAVPNIARSLGLVPSATELFFGTFRPHYALKDIPLSISQAQAEFVASRVSAINECFY